MRVERIGLATLYLGDCREVLADIADASVDAVVTDPPYGLSFMGKKWDYDVPSADLWREVFRVLKPGGHLLAFAGTRTQHRMAVNIEDAGFEIRDMIAWVYGSGFPKSHDVSKAIDRAAGELKPEGKAFTVAGYSHAPDKLLHTAPSKGYVPPPAVTEAARQWQGWGTALKPALEPITVARKPLIGTVAENVLAHGTGALNVDACRVGRDSEDVSGWSQTGSKASDNRPMSGANYERPPRPDADGRWPANLIHDGSDEVVGLFPQSESVGGDGYKNSIFAGGKKTGGHGLGDSGSAARFFYCAKASKEDRDEGLDGFVSAKTNDGRKVDADNAFQRGATLRANTHPTVKPTDLMRYLCRLVTPPGGVVLDPFMGSGTTGKAAALEGFQFIGIEREADYLNIACRRIEQAQRQGDLLRDAVK